MNKDKILNRVDSRLSIFEMLMKEDKGFMFAIEVSSYVKILRELKEEILSGEFDDN